MGGGLTSANTAPYLITVPTALSVDSLISGEYSTSKPSRLWSDERRDSACTIVINCAGWAATNRQTVVGTENRTSRDQRYFPTSITSVVLISQKRTNWWSRRTWYGELALVGAPIIIENPFKVDSFARLSGLRPK